MGHHSPPHAPPPAPPSPPHLLHSQARRLRDHAHRRRQVAVLPAAGDVPAGDHDRRLPARLSHPGPGVRDGEPGRPGVPALVDTVHRRAARGLRRDVLGERRRDPRPPRLRDARAALGVGQAAELPVLARAQPQARALRHRRGALRVAVGPRLPPRLQAAGVSQAQLPQRAARRADGDGDRARQARRRLDPEDARAGRAGVAVHHVRLVVQPAEPLLRGAQEAEGVHRGHRADPARAPPQPDGDRVLLLQEGLRGGRAQAQREAGIADGVLALPRRHGPDLAEGRAGAVDARRASRHLRDDRLRHG